MYNEFNSLWIVVSGMDAVNKIADTPLADPDSGKPVTPQVINAVQVMAVTPQNDPYEKMLHFETPTTAK